MESVESEEDRDLFKKWYKLDPVSSPMVYVLQPIVAHHPGMGGEDPVERGECTRRWKEEAQRMIEVLGNILPDGQKQKNLTSGE